MGTHNVRRCEGDMGVDMGTHDVRGCAGDMGVDMGTYNVRGCVGDMGVDMGTHSVRVCVGDMGVDMGAHNVRGCVGDMGADMGTVSQCQGLCQCGRNSRRESPVVMNLPRPDVVLALARSFLTWGLAYVECSGQVTRGRG
jgi:hypothetical protein